MVNGSIVPLAEELAKPSPPRLLFKNTYLPRFIFTKKISNFVNMNSLTFVYKGREITAPLEVIDKGLNTIDYHLRGKDGLSLFIFRYMGPLNWSHIYGELKDDLKEAILDALIERFERTVVKVFWWRGQRQIVEVSFPLGGGAFNVRINKFFIATIQYEETTGTYSYHYHNPSWLKDRHMEYFIELIKAGKVYIPEMPY